MRPLRFLVISVFLNIALDLLFVAALHMGIGGAALMYLFMGTAIVIMYAGCPLLLGLFTTDSDVISIGVAMMRYLLPFSILYVPNGVFFSTLRGMGDSLRPAMITFLGVCALRILWVLFVFPQFPTIKVLLFCFPVSWSVTAVTSAVYYRWYKKTHVPNAVSWR